MNNFINLLAVMSGGAVGAVARFTLNNFISSLLATPFPVGILCINASGAFCMGLLMGAIARSGKAHATLFLLLGTGFLGGYTTFSTFSMDTFSLFSGDLLRLALLNIATNTLLCVLAAGAGYSLIYRVRPSKNA